MKIKHRLNLATLALAATLMCSCGTQRNQITYFQDIDQIPASAWNQVTDPSPRLKAHDELSIIVNAVDQAAIQAFNKPEYVPIYPGSTNVNTQPRIQTYRVDQEGNIIFPVLGTVHVMGMTTLELRNLLEQKISAYVENPLVTVNLTSFAVSVLGEVGHPGLSYFGTNRGTILEAIALRGDLTVYGDRTNVLLIREVDGKRESHRIDLTSAEVINSPYYYLQQNDVIYVSPNDTRRSSARYNSMKQQNLSMISTIVSVVSVLTTLAIAIWK